MGQPASKKGFTLVETLVVLLLFGVSLVVITSVITPLFRQEARLQNEWYLQSESLLFFHDLARELRAAREIEIRQGMLFATVPQPKVNPPLQEELFTYQYYLDQEGRFIRRVRQGGSYVGYTILLQHVQTLQLNVEETGVVRITGTMRRDGAEHSFEWSVLPRPG